MKRLMVLLLVAGLSGGCEKDNIDLDEYVMPVQLHASRNQEGILLNWYSNLTLNRFSSNSLFLPGAVNGESFRLFHSAGDSVGFNLVDLFNRDTRSHQFNPGARTPDHFFRMEVSAGDAKPFSTMIHVSMAQNPEIIKLTEYPYDYNSDLGNVNPDNRKIIYSRLFNWAECCEDYSILTYEIQTNDEKLLLAEAASPRWDPAGEWVSFTSAFDTSGNPQPSNIGLLEYATDSVVQLTTGNHFFDRPTWHPDGSEIIFLSDIPDNEGNDYWEVVRYDLSSEQLEPLGGSSGLKVLNLPYSLASDGRRLAYVEYSDNFRYRIEYFNLNTEESSTLIESRWNEFNPAYSPDGKYLAFLSDRSGKLEIWIMDLASGELRQITGEEGTIVDSELVWSPDSRRLYFKQSRDSVFGIFYLEIGK